MSREWKPGDVAMVTSGDLQRRAIRTADDAWSLDSGWADCLVDSQLEAAHPLAVIDPDGPEVNRLVALLGTSWSRPISDLRAALRSFVTPPRPEEPTGLGAVVEDVEGYRWVYSGGPQPTEGQVWFSPNLNGSALYAEIDVVRIIAEGVTA